MIKAERYDGPVNRKIGYPKLMLREGDNVLVLMTGDNGKGLGIGFVVSAPASNDAFDVGYHSSYWGLIEFADYTGLVKLVNA